ncbi:hypothetical protein ACOMHN_052799 [Nucella lapillus]
MLSFLAVGVHSDVIRESDGSPVAYLAGREVQSLTSFASDWLVHTLLQAGTGFAVQIGEDFADSQNRMADFGNVFALSHYLRFEHVSVLASFLALSSPLC